MWLRNSLFSEATCVNVLQVSRLGHGLRHVQPSRPIRMASGTVLRTNSSMEFSPNADSMLLMLLLAGTHVSL